MMSAVMPTSGGEFFVRTTLFCLFFFRAVVQSVGVCPVPSFADCEVIASADHPHGCRCRSCMAVTFSSLFIECFPL